MEVTESNAERIIFIVKLTLSEYELLRNCSKVDEVNYEKVLKKLILDALHKDQT